MTPLFNNRQFLYQLVSSLEAYEYALGIRSIAFQPTSTKSPSTHQHTNVRAMAVSSFDGKIRMLSIKSWQVSFVLSCVHPRDMESSIAPPNENGYMLVEELCSPLSLVNQSSPSDVDHKEIIPLTTHSSRPYTLSGLVSNFT